MVAAVRPSVEGRQTCGLQAISGAVLALQNDDSVRPVFQVVCDNTVKLAGSV